MEKIPAARAMDWSIELEKGLRSKVPGRSIEAIEQIGPNLVEWSNEPGITLAVANMYGLVPGVDRTFANTILLRLADAFRRGDNYIRRCILRIFLLEFKHLSKKGKCYDGITAKRRVPNYAELLKRVKVVFDTGDVTAKSLALCLFGCWADLAKDSAHIRYLILLSVQSSHVSEAKASLFAAGCFCQLSEDFACVMLKILTDMISSPASSSDVKLAAVRVFARMQCSSFMMKKAYKAGKILLVSSIHDELVAGVMLSLSKLASKSSLLIPEQVDLLISIISGNSSYSIKATALKCLSSMLARGACSPSLARKLLAVLLHLIDDGGLPQNFHSASLQILQKIIQRVLPDRLESDVAEFLKLIQVLENVAQSSIEAKRHLALDLLVDLLCSCKNMSKHYWDCLEKWHATLSRFSTHALAFQCPEKCPATSFQNHKCTQAQAFASAGDGLSLLVCHVTSLVTNQLTTTIKQMHHEAGREVMFKENMESCHALHSVRQEIRLLLPLLLQLAQNFPASIFVSLDQLKYVMEILVSVLESFHIELPDAHGEMCRRDAGVKEMGVVSRLSEFKYTEQLSIVSKMMSCIFKFLDSCLRICGESDLLTNEVYHRVELMIDTIQQNSFHVCDLYDVFRLWLHSFGVHLSYDSCINELEIDANTVHSHNAGWFSQESRTLNFTKQMLKSKNYWEAYKAGKDSCLQGLWFTAAFTCRKLIDHVQSDSNRSWLRSLMLLSGSESEIKLLLFPEAGMELVNELHTEPQSFGKPFNCLAGNASEHVKQNSDLHGLESQLATVYNRICAAEQCLTAAGILDGVYYFQRWFLSLRAKTMVILIELLGLVGSHRLTEYNLEKGAGGNLQIKAFMQNACALIYGLASISSQLNKLAKAYDLLAISFLDIDHSSVRSISRLAVNCSLLSFAVTFAINFSSSPTYLNLVSSGKLPNLSHNVLLEDLVERLRGMDDNVIIKLQQFFTGSGDKINHLYFKTQMHCSSYKDRASLLITRFSVFHIHKIQEDANAAKDVEQLCVLFVRGLQLMADILRNWMELPFQIPKYFFRVRPCTGAEIFVFGADPTTEDEISVFLGSQLSLNICIQLKNARTYVDVSNMYCILTISLLDRVIPGKGERKRQSDMVFDVQKTEELLEMNDMLLLNIRSNIQKENGIHLRACSDNSRVTSFICFELNERGQGFSTCLLDVSSFPVGTFQIKWHSGCIDKNGSYWSLLPLNAAPTFTIKQT